MSCNYADGLSPYKNKGKLGLAEKFDSLEDVQTKVQKLAKWINLSNHVVIHTGAGISTSAGIPDFRGPNGVWTLERKGEKPSVNISFNEAIPTKTHMAISKLVEEGKVQYVISQNIDGLHLKSGLPRKNLAELHGNMFVEQCHQCQRQFVSNVATSSVGQKCLEKVCLANKLNGRPCRGKLHDTILDWEHHLPEKDLSLSDFHSGLADLSICLGTTLQIMPSGNLPLRTKRYNKGRLVICNLQPTKHNHKADLLINAYVDDIMETLMKNLNLPIPDYDKTKNPCLNDSVVTDWTISDNEYQRIKMLYEEKYYRGKKNRKNKIKENVEDVKKDIKREKIDPGFVCHYSGDTTKDFLKPVIKEESDFTTSAITV